MGKLIAKTYGDALYELAMEENKIDLFSQEVAALSAVMKENEDLTKRLDVSMDEALRYAKKADSAAENAAKGKRAMELLAKLQRENPEAYEQLIHPTPKPKSNTNFKF